MDNNTNNMMIMHERHLMSRPVQERFASVLSMRAVPFIQGVLLAVATSENLQKCTPDSIQAAAMEAAILELSCAPSVKQAYLLPIMKRYKEGNQWRVKWEAMFYPHYLGLYQLAMRSGQYLKLDVIALPHGYKLQHDLGTHQELVVDGLGNVVKYSPDISERAAGGWLAYYVAKNGASKNIFNTKAQIHERVRTYPSYKNPKSNWHDTNQVHIMEKKDMLRQLLKYADKQGITDEKLHRAMQAADQETSEILDGEVTPNMNALPVDEAFK